MRRIAIIIPLLLLLVSPITVSAEPQDFVDDLRDILPDDLPFDATDPEQLSQAVGFEIILAEIYELLRDDGAAIFSFLFSLFGIVVLAALGRTVDERLRPAVRTATSAVATVTIAGMILPAIEAVGGAMVQICDFFGKLMPIFSAINLAGGGINSATVSSTGMSITLSVIGGLSTRVLLLSSAMLFALCMLADLGGVGDGLLRGVRSFFSWGIGIVCFLFGALLALQTVISGASDGILMRTARFAASGSIPIVGNTVSGAMSTLASGLSYVKSITGTASIFVIGWIAMSPLVLL